MSALAPTFDETRVRCQGERAMTTTQRILDVYAGKPMSGFVWACDVERLQ